MKKMKKVLSLLLVLSVAVASFSACGTKAAKDDKWYIGGIGPVTGGAAVYGQSV